MTTPDPKHDPNATENRFSGIHPDNAYPLSAGQLDLVQEMKAQARAEGARTRRESSDEPRLPHPAFVEKGPDRHALGRYADENKIPTPGSLDGAAVDPTLYDAPADTTTTDTTTTDTTTTDTTTTDTVA